MLRSSRHFQLFPWPNRGRRLLAQMAQFELRFRALSTGELRRASAALQFRAMSGEAAGHFMAEAFALMRESARRALGLRHYDVQVRGGAVLFQQSIAEMQTGEGKTLTAILPLYLAALDGNGAHLATANDYLARRDAEEMRPAFELLGLSVGTIQSTSSRRERQAAYGCDVTYGAAREFGFDFLRDRLREFDSRGASVDGDLLGKMLGISEPSTIGPSIQRELCFMLVDEADSVLIDEAQTPLVVSNQPESSESAAALFEWAARVAERFLRDDDYEHDLTRKTITLTAAGRRKVRDAERPDLLSSVPLFDLYEHVERGLRVTHQFHREQHYIVRDGQVVIVDENTGRLAEGRKWRDGLHQAIEAREGLQVTVKAGDAARITVQDFFLLYTQLAGMTGTATSASREFQRIYRLRTTVIPTNHPSQRVHQADRVFGSSTAKWEAVAAETLKVHQSGRPVLIGTRSIDQSETLSRLLSKANIEHQVLNANRHAEEADIVANAGAVGKVTVATNMAGRGTDIRLGEGVAELGGLHVIGTELHASSRIDRQLYGRCARQGDPGTVRQFMALDDSILADGLGTQTAERLRVRGQSRHSGLDRLRRLFRRAQYRVERTQFRQRQMLLHHEQQRRKAQHELGQDPYLDSIS